MFLILDREGAEFDRLELTGELREFDDNVIAKLEAMESSYRREQNEIIEYLKTWVVSTVDVDATLNELVSQLDAKQYATRESAGQKLESLGESAFQFLRTYQPRDAESMRRTRSIIRLLERRRDAIIRFGLDHDIEYLAQHQKDHPLVNQYLKQILPADFQTDDIQQRWRAEGQKYHWDVENKQFLLRSTEVVDENQ